MTTCKNCGHAFEGRYCNHCGQSSKTHRIDIHFLWEDVEHGILHYDKGIIYTLKQLFLKPGYVIRDYINGKRVHHFKPISLCIILATLYALVYHFLDVKLISTDNNTSVEIFEEIIKHYYWFVFITIPIYAIGTLIAFRDKDYNFWEYFILEAFKVSQRLLVHIIFLPIIYFLSNPEATKIILMILSFLDIGLIIWTNLQFFSKLSKIKVSLLSLVSYIIYVSITIVLSVILYLSFF